MSSAGERTGRLLTLLPRAWGMTRRHPLIAIFVLAALIRVLLAIPALGDARRAYVIPDSFEYDQIAINLIHGNGYSQSTEWPYAPDIRRTPVYPLLLAATYAVVGPRPEIAVGLNVLMGSLACVLTGILGRQLYGHRAGTVAGLFLATDLTSAEYNLTLMTETVFTVFVLLCVLALTGYSRRESLRSTVFAGLWCGVAILTRPIALFLPLLLGPALVMLGRAAAPRWHLLGAGAFVVVAALFPLGWTLRNYLVAGVAQPTSLVAINSYYQRAAMVQAREQGVAVTTERRALADQVAGVSSPAAEENPADLNAMEARSLQIILSDPIGYAVVHAEGTARMLGPEVDILRQLQSEAPAVHGPPASLATFVTAGDRSSDRSVNATAFVGGLAQVVLVYALAVVGIGVGLRHPATRDVTALVVLVLIYFLVISGPEAYPRFRVPFMPIVTALAGLGVWSGWQRLIYPRTGRTQAGRLAPE